MGRSYKSPCTAVEAGHAREALFHHRCGAVRGHGSFLPKPGHRVEAGHAREELFHHRCGAVRGHGPFLQKPGAPRRSGPCPRSVISPSVRAHSRPWAVPTKARAPPWERAVPTKSPGTAAGAGHAREALFHHRCGPFAAMGLSYKSSGHRVGAGHAREALFHHRCGPIRGHGPFLQKPRHRVGAGHAREPLFHHRCGAVRGHGPFLQKARDTAWERAMPAKRCFTIGAGPFLQKPGAPRRSGPCPRSVVSPSARARSRPWAAPTKARAPRRSGPCPRTVISPQVWGRSYKNPGTAVGAGHAREALFHHRRRAVRGHGSFLPKPGHRRGSGPFLQKARAPPQERAMPANRCFTIGAGPFAAMGRSYKNPGTA